RRSTPRPRRNSPNAASGCSRRRTEGPPHPRRASLPNAVVGPTAPSAHGMEGRPLSIRWHVSSVLVAPCATLVVSGQRFCANRYRHSSCSETSDRGWTSCSLHIDLPGQGAASIDVARSVPFALKLRPFSDLLRRPNAPIFGDVKRTDSMASCPARLRRQLVALCRIVRLPKIRVRESG